MHGRRGSRALARWRLRCASLLTTASRFGHGTRPLPTNLETGTGKSWPRQPRDSAYLGSEEIKRDCHRSVSVRLLLGLRDVCDDRVRARLFGGGTDHQGGRTPSTCNSSGSLLGLFSAVLCPTLSWPTGDLLVHKLTWDRLPDPSTKLWGNEVRGRRNLNPHQLANRVYQGSVSILLFKRLQAPNSPPHSQFSCCCLKTLHDLAHLARL